MNVINPRALYAVEPRGERFTQWLAEATRWAVRLYWELFIALPIQLIFIAIALMSLIVGVLDIVKQPGNASHDLPLIGVSAAFLLFHRVRAFFWALLACFVVWLPLTAGLLISLLGEDFKAASAGANIALVLLYLLPPLVAAAFIDQARHRKQRTGKD